MASEPPVHEEQSTLLRPVFDPTPVPESAFVLSVSEGPDTGKTFRIDVAEPAPVLVGQSPSCQIRLTDRATSRRHASLELSGRRLRITDLGSRNGTFVDGVAVLDAYLRGGELVRVGGTALRVETDAPGQSDQIPTSTNFGPMIGASTEMRRLYPLFERLAASDVPVVIEGETGTGKEVLAEALHQRGPRSEGPFVVFDCTAVPPTLVESELFGHERGAFTGAVASRKGVFEQAHGGTLLIDEIGDLDLSLQPKLLRALERSEVRRVGGSQSIRVDARIIAATRRDLDREVQSGRFRDDLFHRLAVARVELPPLRRRRGDVMVLAQHFAREIGGEDTTLRPQLLWRWIDYGWPGNVRELRNAVARHLALGELDGTGVERGESTSADGTMLERILALDLPLADARQRLLDEFEPLYIQRMLSLHGGNVTRAAAASGVARRYFQILKAKRGR
jgi:two-component system, NtrC family, response regulator HydG